MILIETHQPWFQSNQGNAHQFETKATDSNNTYIALLRAKNLKNFGLSALRRAKPWLGREICH